MISHSPWRNWSALPDLCYTLYMLYITGSLNKHIHNDISSTLKLERDGNCSNSPRICMSVLERMTFESISPVAMRLQPKPCYSYSATAEQHKRHSSLMALGWRLDMPSWDLTKHGCATPKSSQRNGQDCSVVIFQKLNMLFTFPVHSRDKRKCRSIYV